MSGAGAVRVEAARPATRCALCHDDLGLEVGACPGCGTATHGECRAEAGGCPTLGCIAAEDERAEAPRASWSTRGVEPGQLGAVVGVLAMVLGLAAGLAVTRCAAHAFLAGAALLGLTFVFALLGMLVGSLCGRVERWRRGAELPVLVASWPYLPLLLAGSGGAAMACWVVVALHGYGHW